MDKIYNSDMPKIIAAYKNGETLQSLGFKYGVTRERIRQRLKDAGVPAKASLMKRRARKEQRLEDACMARTGCSRALLKELRMIGRQVKLSGLSRERTPIGAFATQRCNARSRGITWNLSLGQWWQIWQDSGKWPDRGRERERFVMARHGDAGPYSIENVSIQTAGRNCSDARIKTWAEKKACGNQILSV